MRALVLAVVLMVHVASDETRARVEEIYRQHNPEKLSDVPNILAKYKDKPELLLRRLAHRYSLPTPTNKPTDKQTPMTAEATTGKRGLQNKMDVFFRTLDDEMVQMQQAGQIFPALRLIQDVEAEVKRRVLNAQTRVRMAELVSASAEVTDDAAGHVHKHCQDGMTNHLESDVDCGGGICERCTGGQVCMLDSDCQSGACEGSVCKAPKPTGNNQSSAKEVLDLMEQNAQLMEELIEVKQKMLQLKQERELTENENKKMRQFEREAEEEAELSDYDDVDYADVDGPQPTDTANQTINAEMNTASGNDSAAAVTDTNTHTRTGASTGEQAPVAPAEEDDWGSECAVDAGPGSCACEELDVTTLSAGRWNKEYLGKRPVLIRFPEGASSWTDPSLWEFQRLRQRYGSLDVMAGYSDLLVKNRGRGYNMMRLRDYIDYHIMPSLAAATNNLVKGGGNSSAGMDAVKAAIKSGGFDGNRAVTEKTTGGKKAVTRKRRSQRGGDQDSLYVFDSDFYPDSDLQKSMQQPSFLPSDLETTQTLWFMGKANSSVAFHRHEDSWCGLVHGHKRWWLYPPHKTPPGGPFPSFEQNEWVDSVLPKLTPRHRPLQCEHKAGTILYVPEGWYHAVTNVEPSVAVAHQIKPKLRRGDYMHFHPNWNHFGNKKAQLMESKKRGRKTSAEVDASMMRWLSQFRGIPDSSECERLGCTEPLLLAGRWKSAIGRLNESMQFFDTALKINPLDAITWRYKGMALEQGGGGTEEVLQVYEHAYSVSPKSAEIVESLAQFYDKSIGDTAALEKAVKILNATLAQPKFQELGKSKSRRLKKSGFWRNTIQKLYDMRTSINNDLQYLRKNQCTRFKNGVSQECV